MSKLKAFARRFMKENSGAAMIEYSILIGLVAAVFITAVAAVSTRGIGRRRSLCTALSISCGG